jgi:hypothetical protein
MHINKEDKKQIWLWVHSIDCFEHAIDALDEIIKMENKNNNKRFKNLMSAFYVTYGKPFGKNTGIVKLSTDIIPKEYIKLHKQIIHFRDKFFAHSDLNAKLKEPDIYIDNVIANIQNRKLNWQLLYYLPNETALEQYKQLAKELLIKCNYYLDKLNKKYLPKCHYSDGIYPLNVRDDNDIAFKIQK